MQTLKRFLLHPVTIILLFCFIIISGESNGAFYIFILLLGFPHGVLHSIIGIVGIAILVASLYLQNSSVIAGLKLASAICFLLSLLRFFTQPGADYNYDTFRQFVPLVVLIIFSLILLWFIVEQLQLLGLVKYRSHSI